MQKAEAAYVLKGLPAGCCVVGREHCTAKYRRATHLCISVPQARADELHALLDAGGTGWSKPCIVESKGSKRSEVIRSYSRCRSICHTHLPI